MFNLDGYAFSSGQGSSPCEATEFQSFRIAVGLFFASGKNNLRIIKSTQKKDAPSASL